MQTILCISPTCFGNLPLRFQGADTNTSLKHIAIKQVTIDLHMLWYQYTQRSDVIQF